MDDQRKDHPDPKRPQKESTSNNYRPIMCLPMMWKILIQIRDLQLTNNPWTVPWRTKGIMDQHILKESKTRQKNVAMVWIDNKKACNMIP